MTLFKQCKASTNRSLMNIQEKIAPFIALQARLPTHVHDIRFDDGADGEVWVYVNGHAPPRVRPAYLCFVARDDTSIAVDITAIEAELAAWVEATKARVSEFARFEFARLQSELLESLLDAKHVLFLEVERQRGEAEQAYNAAKQVTDETDEQTAASLRAAVEHAQAKLDRALADFENAATQPTALTLADLFAQATEVGKARVIEVLAAPPARMTHRLAELREAVGCLAVHLDSNPAGRQHVPPDECASIVGDAAAVTGWTR